MDYHKEIVEPGDRFSELARKVCLESHENSPAIEILRGGENMRAMDGFAWNKCVQEAILRGDIREVFQSDGAGGKPQFFTLEGTSEVFAHLAWEIITMNADDVACRGGLPVMISSSNIDVKQITRENWHLCESLLKGFGSALDTSRLVLLTGETAVMPDSITAFCDTNDPSQFILTWNATCLGLAPSRVAAKPPMQAGMTVIGFADEGYRCNGGTKMTSIIKKLWGTDPNEIMGTSISRAFVKALVEPSRSYAQTIAGLNGWRPDGTRTERSPADLRAIAHVTGGGVWSKLADVLPEGIGVDLHSMPLPPWVLEKAQELADKAGEPMTDRECYGTFHGGCGLLTICDRESVGLVLHEASEDGHIPYVVGETISSETSEIVITSRFADKGKRLSSLD